MERTNALSIEEFSSRYVTPIASPAESSQNKHNTSLDVYSAANISANDLEACLDLIELTSSEAYAASGAGWSRPKKRKEMKLPDMKYLILRDVGLSKSTAAGAETEAGPSAGNESLTGAESDWTRDPGKGGVLGFLSFMVTYEDGKEVIYCYEIHLAPGARGRGLGSILMDRMEEIGRLVGLEKAMLTVFKSNEAARRFYQKGGYVVDEYSPQPRRLRNGTLKEFDYEILSKILK